MYKFRIEYTDPIAKRRGKGARHPALTIVLPTQGGHHGMDKENQ